MEYLTSIAASLSDTPEEGPLPVAKWHPAREASIDIEIRADGRWIHEGEEIRRPKLVRLFSRILRRDGDGYVLVTPAEKLSIVVEDVPFLLTSLERVDGVLQGRTNVGDRVRLGPDQPLEMRAAPDGEGELPYVRVRDDLWARFARPVWYRLVEEYAQIADGRVVVMSGSHRFDLGAAA